LARRKQRQGAEAQSDVLAQACRASFETRTAGGRMKPTLTKKQAVNLYRLLKPNIQQAVSEDWLRYRHYLTKIADTNGAAARELADMNRVIDDFEREALNAYLEWLNEQKIKTEEQ